MQKSPDVRTAEPLLGLFGCGSEIRKDASYTFDSAQRKEPKHVNIQLTLSGEGYHENRKGRSVVGPGRAYVDVIPGPFKYGYNPGSSTTYRYVFVSLYGSEARRWGNRLVMRFGNVLSIGLNSAVEEQMLEIVRLRDSELLPDRYQLSSRIYHLLMTIHSTLLDQKVRDDPRTTRAIQLIASRAIDSSFCVNELADTIGCSREFLSRNFKENVGVSPSEYLNQCRIRLAAKLLRTGDKKLDVVARSSGFSNANYFCRVFRKRVGVTPDQFRSQQWRTLG